MCNTECVIKKTSGIEDIDKETRGGGRDLGCRGLGKEGLEEEECWGCRT